MQTDTSRGTFEDVTAAVPAGMAEIALSLRQLIQALFDDIVEVPRPAEQHIDYGVLSGKMDAVFAYICPMEKYVRLGFYYGAGLPDPGKLLVGEGKRLRHIKLSSRASVDQPEIRQLLAAAYEQRKASLPPGKLG